jgi:hypothetical protein
MRPRGTGAIIVVLLAIMITMVTITQQFALAHTADYWAGYNAGKADRAGGGPYDPGSFTAPNGDSKAWLNGYWDGYYGKNPSSTEGHNNGNHYTGSKTNPTPPGGRNASPDVG